MSDGFAPQTNIVRQDGRRGVLVTILKAGNASTLDVVNGVREASAARRDHAAAGAEDSASRRINRFLCARAVNGVIREAMIAACLTGLMILMFLGSWRSTLIIAVSIPLSILTSIIVLGFLHETINIMTLGGLALAVGILVDDATVTIENIERYLEEGRSSARGDPGRRWADRGSGAGFHALHLHRVSADVFPERAWRGTCSFRWPKRWCSPCSRPTFFRERWFRRWRCIC